MVTNYRHLLVAIELSQEDDLIIAKALNLSKSYQASLSVIHVLDNIPMPDTRYGTRIFLHEASGNELLEQEKIKFREFAMRWSIHHDHCWLVWGVPQNEIVDYAVRNDVDLIVVGSHGRHGLSLLLGATANSVVSHAPCDVLAVRLL